MLVILEGADGSGKTTLATRIRQELGQYSLFLRTSGPPSIVEIANVCHWIDSHPASLPIIMDRYPIISEYVYGPIIRGKCKHALTLPKIASTLRHAMIIYCRPSYEALREGVLREAQLEGVVLNHRDIVKAYDSLMSSLEGDGVYVKKYDYTTPGQRVISDIQTFIKGRTP